MTPEQRLAAFQQFVKARPDDPFTRYALAMHLRSMGRLDESAAAFAELTSRTPDYVPSWLMYGQTLEQAGRPAEASRVYREGMAVAERRQDAHARGELEAALAQLGADAHSHD
jgi:predicted Zn-dependent protease